MKRTRHNHGASVKVQVALASVKGDKTLADLAEHFRVHPAQITEWKQQLLARAADVFGGTKPASDTPDLKTLHAKIGQPALENDFVEGALIKGACVGAEVALMRRIDKLHLIDPFAGARILHDLEIIRPNHVRAADTSIFRYAGVSCRCMQSSTRPVAACWRDGWPLH